MTKQKKHSTATLAIFFVALVVSAAGLWYAMSYIFTENQQLIAHPEVPAVMQSDTQTQQDTSAQSQTEALNDQQDSQLKVDQTQDAPEKPAQSQAEANAESSESEGTDSAQTAAQAQESPEQAQELAAPPQAADAQPQQTNAQPQGLILKPVRTKAPTNDTASTQYNFPKVNTQGLSQDSNASIQQIVVGEHKKAFDQNAMALKQDQQEQQAQEQQSKSDEQAAATNTAGISASSTEQSDESQSAQPPSEAPASSTAQLIAAAELLGGLSGTQVSADANKQAQQTAALDALGKDQQRAQRNNTTTERQTAAPVIDILTFHQQDALLVMAGRAQSNQALVLRIDDQEIARFEANEQGQWAFEQQIALSQGAHQLALYALDALQTAQDFNALDPVNVAVASLYSAQDSLQDRTPLAQQTSAQASPEGAQISEAAQGAQVVTAMLDDVSGEVVVTGILPALQDGFGITRLSYDVFGNLNIQGQIAADTLSSEIRLYIDNQLIDSLKPQAPQWSSAPKYEALSVGQHVLRADVLNIQGQVVQRIEQEFDREQTSWDRDGRARMTIKRGDMLWSIASRAYGKGEKYTLIFEQNRNQIKDPDLIYPNQVFELVRE